MKMKQKDNDKIKKKSVQTSSACALANWSDALADLSLRWGQSRNPKIDHISVPDIVRCQVIRNTGSMRPINAMV